MSKRAINGKTITRGAQEAALQPEKPLLFGYRPSMATKYAENARKSEENGPYGQVFANFHTFFIYKPYGPENSQEFQQWGPTYDPQLAGYAHPIARYTPIWYSPWVAG